MLLIVQLMQVARAQTTYESMRSHSPHHGAGEALTSFVTTGSTSMEGAQVDGSTPPQGSSSAEAHPKRKEGCWQQWKRLLGLDTFIATALHGSNAAQVQARQRSNPFTRGCLTNCKDFWFEPGPIFGRKENGAALLDGQRVDYTRLYEPPPRMTVRRRGGDEYAAVDTDDRV